jgi:hypothetical protein
VAEGERGGRNPGILLFSPAPGSRKTWPLTLRSQYFKARGTICGKHLFNICFTVSKRDLRKPLYTHIFTLSPCQHHAQGPHSKTILILTPRDDGACRCATFTSLLPSLSAVSLPPCFTIARIQATAGRTAEAAASSRPAAARAAIAYTEMLGSRQKVHYVEDSMRLRKNLVASARRHLPCQPSPTPGCGATPSCELTQIGINKRTQNHSSCYDTNKLGPGLR